MLQWQSRVVVTETKWPAKPKVFTAVTILSMLSTSPLQKKLLISGLDDLTCVPGSWVVPHPFENYYYGIFIYYQELIQCLINDTLRLDTTLINDISVVFSFRPYPTYSKFLIPQVLQYIACS